MTPSEKESWRWRFAGQALGGLIACEYECDYDTKFRTAVAYAKSLILELERTAPKEECEHSWVRRRDGSSCSNCGLVRFGIDIYGEQM